MLKCISLVFANHSMMCSVYVVMKKELKRKNAVYLFVCFVCCLSVHLFVCLFIWFSVCLFVCLFVCQYLHGVRCVKIQQDFNLLTDIWFKLRIKNQHTSLEIWNDDDDYDDDDDDDGGVMMMLMTLMMMIYLFSFAFLRSRGHHNGSYQLLQAL